MNKGRGPEKELGWEGDARQADGEPWLPELGHSPVLLEEKATLKEHREKQETATRSWPGPTPILQMGKQRPREGQ